MKKYLLLTAMMLIISGFIYSNETNEAVLVEFNQLQSESSIAIDDWRVIHPPASQTNNSLTRSYIREVQSRLHGTIMGVRIYFPPELRRFPTQVTIQPPTENGIGRLEIEGGIRLRSVSMNVNSLYLPVGLGISLSIRVNDRDNMTLPMGDLNFEGWRELVWHNPNLARERENNTGFYDSVSFNNFIVHNIAEHDGDTIFYIRDVKLSYDTYED